MKDQNIGWVLPVIIEQRKGISEGALKKQKQRGKLKEGFHWKKVHGRIWFHFERYDEMIDHAA